MVFNPSVVLGIDEGIQIFQSGTVARSSGFTCNSGCSTRLGFLILINVSKVTPIIGDLTHGIPYI
jgi:hypothetical protein